MSNPAAPGPPSVPGSPDGTERRIAERRRIADRRCGDERRLDNRLQPGGSVRRLRDWIRSRTRPRLGVDRRKPGGDRRKLVDRRQTAPRSLLTPEELDDLLA
ncbi:MAG: hypothetical protein ACOX5Z_09695 [Desulfobulbus sp.]|jgi:hypothetical protein